MRKPHIVADENRFPPIDWRFSVKLRAAVALPYGTVAATMLVLCCSLASNTLSLPAQTIRILKPISNSKIVHPYSLLGTTMIAVSATPSSVNFSLASGSTATANSAIAVTSTVTLPSSTSINVYGYFVTSTAGLTGNVSTAKIPTSAIYGIVPTGVPTTYTAFTQTGPFGGAGASLKLVALSNITVLHTQTDNLTLRIDLSALALPADTYVGTLYIEGQAF